MLIVAALGGNALLRRGQPLTAAAQIANVAVAAAALAPLAREHSLVVTHGNGPQVGLLSLQNEAYHPDEAYPLDVLDAETEGMIGYLLECELGRYLPRSRLATLLTQVVVDRNDPAFAHPTKFVGPVYDEGVARALAGERHWSIAADGARWRRVVPSPEPRWIVELDAVRSLVDKGFVVICGGGGGIPVAGNGAGELQGVEAVIDKDLVSSRLATDLGADALLLLTDVDGVYRDWGTPAAQRIDSADPATLRALGAAAGSMGPKIEAVCRFIEHGGRHAAIGALADVAALARGEAGTSVGVPATVEL